jgi:hypothetical protein
MGRCVPLNQVVSISVNVDAYLSARCMERIFDNRPAQAGATLIDDRYVRDAITRMIKAGQDLKVFPQ